MYSGHEHAMAQNTAMHRRSRPKAACMFYCILPKNDSANTPIAAVAAGEPRPPELPRGC